MLKLIPSWFKRDKDICREDLVKPYVDRARQALLGDELPMAIAHLESGIKVAPDHLEFYLQRAQILQYGMNNYTRALRDYRHILRVLEPNPDHPLAAQCRRGMKDMMAS